MLGASTLHAKLWIKLRYLPHVRQGIRAVGFRAKHRIHHPALHPDVRAALSRDSCGFARLKGSFLRGRFTLSRSQTLSVSYIQRRSLVVLLAFRLTPILTPTRANQGEFSRTDTNKGA